MYEVVVSLLEGKVELNNLLKKEKEAILAPELLIDSYIAFFNLILYFLRRAILMVVALFCLNIAMLAQAVSLKMNNVSVKEAMTQLKNKSGYSFVYKVGDLDTKKIVNVNTTTSSSTCWSSIKVIAKAVRSPTFTSCV